MCTKGHVGNFDVGVLVGKMRAGGDNSDENKLDLNYLLLCSGNGNCWMDSRRRSTWAAAAGRWKMVQGNLRVVGWLKMAEESLRAVVVVVECLKVVAAWLHVAVVEAHVAVMQKYL